MDGLFDSHSHLQLSAFAEDRQAVLDRARQAGVVGAVVVGIDAASSEDAIELAARHDGLYATIGFHPHDAKRLDGRALRLLRELARRPKVVALGEIGLDFYRNLSPAKAQVQAFRDQLNLAAETKLPVVIHSRQADKQTYAVLRDWLADLGGEPPQGLPWGVLHCFSGDLEAAHQYIEMGFLVSIAGNVTYPNAGRLQSVAAALPLEHLMLETDCPFLTPQSHRGKRCEPSHLPETAAQVAALKGASVEEVARATTANAERLYRLSQVARGGAGRPA